MGRSGERGSGISVLPARYDDDYPIEKTYNASFRYQFHSLISKKKKNSCTTCEFMKILTENTTIFEQQNNKQKLQILEALYIRNIQSKRNRNNFEYSANVLKCL